MEIKYLKIFTDKLVIIEKEDGTRLRGIIETANNDLDAIEDLLPIQREFSAITVSASDSTSTKLINKTLQLRDIFSIEII